MKRLYLSCLLIFLYSNPLWSEVQDKQLVTLDTSFVRVLENHPRFTINDYEARAIAARIKSAAMAPADKVHIEMENLGGTGNARYLQGMEATLSLARVLELGDKAAKRTNVVSQEASVLRDTADAERLDIMAETARRFVELVLDQERLKFAQQALVLIEKAAATVQTRVDASLSAPAELHRVEIDRARLELQVEHAEHELANARVQLTTLWGETSPGLLQARADLFELDVLKPFADYASLLDRNPDLVRLATQERLASARLQLAQAQRQPDIELRGGVRYLGDSNDAAFVISASIPIGTKTRAKPVMEEAEWHSRIQPLEYEDRKNQLYAMLFEIYQELIHSKTAVDMLQQRIIPAAEKALQSYEKLYSTGRYTLLELLEAQRALLQSRLQLIESAAHYHRLRINLERLTGVSPREGEKS